MQHMGSNRYNCTIPAWPGVFASFQIQPVLFRIEAVDVFGNTRVSATFAYVIQGSAPGIDPLFGLLLLCSVPIAILVLVILLKIYERY